MASSDRCTCGHERGEHINGHGICYHGSCPCKSFTDVAVEPLHQQSRRKLVQNTELQKTIDGLDGVIKRLRKALTENTTPDAACSCPHAPPCNDCVEHFSTRENIAAAVETVEVDDRDEEIGRLRAEMRLGLICVACKSSLHPSNTPPRCHDCTPSEDDIEAWEDARAALAEGREKDDD